MSNRIVVSIMAGTAAALVYYLRYRAAGQLQHFHSDFSPSWFGAQMLLQGRNPYALIGPGKVFDWPWPAVYPATAFVAAIPFTVLPEAEASVMFVFLSFTALTYSITRDNWERLPMLFSMGALASAISGQWTPLITASVGIPALALFLACKPTEGLAMLVRGDNKMREFGIAGALVLILVSLVLFPQWPRVWIGQLHYATQMSAPITRMGGFLIPLALLKWRQKEARFLVALSLVPAVGAWYTMLPLLWVVRTRYEAMILASLSCVGWLLQDRIVYALNETDLNYQIGSLVVWTCFLPSVVMVLLRKNPSPGYMPESKR